MQIGFVGKDASISIRLSAPLKRELQARARRARRSLTAQITACLEREVANAKGASAGKGKLLGLFAGTRVPSDRDFALVRRMLWGSPRRKQARGAPTD